MQRHWEDTTGKLRSVRLPEARREAWIRWFSLRALKSSPTDTWLQNFSLPNCETIHVLLFILSSCYVVLGDKYTQTLDLLAVAPRRSLQLSSRCQGGEHDAHCEYDESDCNNLTTYHVHSQVCGLWEVLGSDESQPPTPSQSFQPGSFASHTSLFQKYRSSHTHFHQWNLHSHPQNYSFARVCNICHCDIPDSHVGSNLKNRKQNKKDEEQYWHISDVKRS